MYKLKKFYLISKNIYINKFIETINITNKKIYFKHILYNYLTIQNFVYSKCTQFSDRELSLSFHKDNENITKKKKNIYIYILYFKT